MFVWCSYIMQLKVLNFNYVQMKISVWPFKNIYILFAFLRALMNPNQHKRRRQQNATEEQRKKTARDMIQNERQLLHCLLGSDLTPVSLDIPVYLDSCMYFINDCNCLVEPLSLVARTRSISLSNICFSIFGVFSHGLSYRFYPRRLFSFLRFLAYKIAFLAMK